jgi:hypothetical protein
MIAPAPGVAAALCGYAAPTISSTISVVLHLLLRGIRALFGLLRLLDRELMFTSFFRADTVTFPSRSTTSVSPLALFAGVTITQPTRTFNPREVLTERLP